MLAAELVALAGTAGTTLVAAMATDAWQVARDGIVRLFGRQGPAKQAAIGAQLDSNAGRVVKDSDPDRVRRGFAGSWQLELEELLEANPAAAGELSAVVAEIQAALPEVLQTWVQTNIARDNATIFAAQGGNVVYHQALSQPPAKPDGGEAEAGPVR
jgi:hypothetical protein